MTLSRLILSGFLFVLFTDVLIAQKYELRFDYNNSTQYSGWSLNQDSIPKKQFPDPKSVMRRSLIVPGWGQVTNKQIWKVPIVYGLLGGLTYYSINLTKQYHDYRAAYYNAVDDSGDLRFGPTPAYLEGVNTSSLQSKRNFLRNRRDFIYVTIGLAYMLNVVDAYVYAHFRSFDVSDDLSLRPSVGTEDVMIATIPAPVLTLKLVIK